MTVEGVHYGPIDAYLDEHRSGGVNQWITLTLAEGKNREVRKVLDALGLTVNRLIRLSYGPFDLGDPGARRGVRGRAAHHSRAAGPLYRRGKPAHGGGGDARRRRGRDHPQARRRPAKQQAVIGRGRPIRERP